jgi:hypothetical protein
VPRTPSTIFYPAFSHPSIQIALKVPLILFPSRRKCSSSLIGRRGISNNRRDSDFAEGDLEERDKQRDHRGSKKIEEFALIFYLCVVSTKMLQFLSYEQKAVVLYIRKKVNHSRHEITIHSASAELLND